MNKIKGLSDTKRSEILDLEQLSSMDLFNLTSNIVDILKARESKKDLKSNSVKSENVSLNEVAILINQLNAIRDKSDNAIQNIVVKSNKPYVYLKFTEFLSEFISYEIKTFGNGEKYAFELKTRIFGVEFISIMSAAEIVELKTTIPDQWEYIQKKVQMEELEGR